MHLHESFWSAVTYVKADIDLIIRNISKLKSLGIREPLHLSSHKGLLLFINSRVASVSGSHLFRRSLHRVPFPTIFSFPTTNYSKANFHICSRPYHFSLYPLYSHAQWSCSADHLTFLPSSQTYTNFISLLPWLAFHVQSKHHLQVKTPNPNLLKRRQTQRLLTSQNLYWVFPPKNNKPSLTILTCPSWLMRQVRKMTPLCVKRRHKLYRHPATFSALMISLKAPTRKKQHQHRVVRGSRWSPELWWEAAAGRTVFAQHRKC